MKIIHSSDWHLGKKLFNQSRLDEQSLFLNWLGQTLEKVEADYLLISGDIFDVPTPPHDALKLFYEFLGRVQKTSKTKCLVLGGNHDSGRLLESISPIIDPERIKIIGELGSFSQLDELGKLIHKDGDYAFSFLPYFRNYEIFNLAKVLCPELELQEELPIEKILEELIDQLYQRSGSCTHKILLGHHLYGSYHLTGSEMNISLSGIESIDLKIFKNKFDYLALGHIHKYSLMSESNPCAVYSGSPIAYRFSETQKKYLSEIEFSKSELTRNKIEIPEFRKLKSIKFIDKKSFIEEIQKLQHSNLESFIELELQAQDFNSENQLFFQEQCSKYSCKLLKLKTQRSESQVKKQSLATTDFLDTDKLFRAYILEKGIQSEDVLEDFTQLLQVSKQEDHDFEHLNKDIESEIEKIEGSQK